MADKLKRYDIFTKCKEKYDISVLIDIHCTSQLEKKWINEWGYVGRIAPFSSTSRGVAILFRNTFEFKIHDEIKDPDGNFIILDVTIQDYRLTLVAVYGPNEDNPTFFENLKLTIKSIDNTSAILVGDWNVVQNHDIDTLNYIRENNRNSKLTIQNMMSELDLVDIWRVDNPDKKIYTWRGPFKKMSRLDYFLITSDVESLVLSSEIGICYRSDHCPITLSLKFHDQTRGKGTWKFNNSLLKNNDFITKVKEVINNVLCEYETDPLVNTEDASKEYKISKQLLWEMIKMKIRGSYIIIIIY